ncbi:MAG: KUP/HAK/KT family potassium transporter [Nitrospirota bacterium]
MPHGGCWSLIIGTFPFSIILVYTKGQKRLYRALKPLPLKEFHERCDMAYRKMNKLQGTTLYFLRGPNEIPPFMIRSMFINGIMYEENIIVSMLRRVDPFGVTGCFREEIGPGLKIFEIQAGYMEVFDVEEILKEAGIDENTIFYGLEEIVTDNIIWKIFSIIKRLNPTFVQFYKLPSHKLHGIITRIEM